MDKIEIINYSEKYKDYFKTLNYEWIQRFFVVEPTDEYTLSNPVESIIDKGGFIYFAKFNAEIIGTFALIKIDNTTFEIAKMAVTETYQNRGIGKMLMDTAIQKAKELNIERLILYSNTNLTTAVNMYFKYGFRVIPKSDFHNNRANIKMEMILKSQPSTVGNSAKMNMEIEYKFGKIPETEEIIELYKSSGINRPTNDKERITKMYANSNLIITAWDKNQLVGISRALTDFCYCCYLSDLAVRKEYQKHGIGKRLIAMTKEKIGDKTMLLLLSAPTAMEYYPKVGFQKADNGFIIKRTQ